VNDDAGSWRGPEHVPFRLLLNGFDLARARVEAVEASDEQAFHAIFETLAWVGAIRDRLGAKRVAEELPAVAGLTYVRNLAVHAGADVLAWIPSTYGVATYGSGTYGGAMRVWEWPPRDRLPPPERKQADSVVAFYDSHVAGRDVRVVLADVSRELHAFGDASPGPRPPAAA